MSYPEQLPDGRWRTECPYCGAEVVSHISYPHRCVDCEGSCQPTPTTTRRGGDKMPDRGMCDRCGKPSVMFRGSWVCTNCGAERAHDPDHDQGPKRKPDGYWRRGGSRGPDRSSR